MNIHHLLNKIFQTGTSAPSHVIGYDSTAKRWKKFTLGSGLSVNGSGVISASGGASWDAELTIANDIPATTETTSETITDFVIPALAYGLYEFELRLRYTSTTGFSSVSPFQCDGASAGQAYPSFVSSEYYAIWDNSRGDEWVGSGGSSQSEPFGNNTASDATARELEVFARGSFFHFNYNDGYFGQAFTPSFDGSSMLTNGLVLKAGGTFKYRKIYDQLIVTP